MKTVLKIWVIVFALSACNENDANKYPTTSVNWSDREINMEEIDNCVGGKTYLPIYSHIYHIHEHRTFDLTITVSIRNTSVNDSVYILKADYYNTGGENIRQYLKKPIFLSPLETIEIVIKEQDTEGGSGANFVFDWATVDGKNPPLFEAVMISTHGQQGLSFTTRGLQINE